MQWPVFSNSLHIGLYKSGEREGEQKDKKEWLKTPRGCDYVFFV
jgi:hypothetical protein